MKNLSEYFKEENIDNTYIKQPVVKHSPDNKYRLEIFYYKIGIKDEHYWNFTRGLVYNNKTNDLLFDIQRNYPSFYSTFLQHNNGNDYMVCGRNYHGGYSILDLTNKKEYCYEPESESPYDMFFCWIEPYYNKTNDTLIVNGCYWGCPFETVIYDFSDPTKFPLKIISRCYLSEEED